MTLAEVRPTELSVELPPPHQRSWAGLIGLLQLLVTVGVFHLAVLERAQGSATLVALAFLFVVPGGLVLKALALRPERPAAHLVYAVGSSIASLLAVILAVRALAPALHLAHPLATQPMLLGLDAFMLLLTVIAAIRRQPLGVRIPRQIPSGAWLLGLPLLTAAGTEVLENQSTSWLVIVGLCASGAALLWSFFQVRKGQEGRVLIVLYCCALSMMWSFSLRSKGLYGFDVQQEYAAFRATAQTLAWNPVAGSSYQAMLSITALPTALWQLTGLSGEDSFKILFPALFALYPVGIFVLARRWLRPVTALLCTCLVFFTASMAAQMPALGRQEIGLILFMGLLLAAFEPAFPRRSAQTLALWLGLAMVVSHYSTTYVALGAFLATRIISLGQRVLRRRASYRAVLGLPLVLILIAFSAWWTVSFTKSDQNVTSFASTVSTNGAQVLPNSGQSLLVRWLAGNVTENVAPRVYFDDVQQSYAQTHPFLLPFMPSVQAEFPAKAESAPVVRPWQPGLALPRKVATTAVRQGTNVALAIGSIGMTVLLLRRRRIDPELSAMVLAMFAVTMAVRLSGSAAFAYNPERLAMQTGALLVVPLGLVAQSVRRRLHALYPARQRWGIKADTPQRAAGVITFALLAIVFIDASGLGARTDGGSPPGNLSTTGEYAERFHSNDQDVASADWIASVARPDLIVFADRYGALTVQTHQKSTKYGLFPDLTPGTLDQRGLVFESSSNIIDGRARGTTPDNLVSSTYQFPQAFLDKFKAVVFDTGWARVYS
jgi:uncharacterized membrane protein